MKKLTIKILILSLFLLSTSNTKPIFGLCLVAAAGAVVGALVVATVGGAIFVGYKAVKHVSSKKKKKSKKRNNRKKTKAKGDAKKLLESKTNTQQEPLVAT